MAKKTDGGQEYSAGAYLVVPDADKPSTWKLRVEESPGKVTIAQLGRAAAALGKGFRGRKVQLGGDERSAALRKLRSLYKSNGVKSEDLPPVLAEAVTSDAFSQMRQAIMKKKKAGASAKTMAEAFDVDESVIDALSEAYLSCNYVAVTDDDAPSFESVCAAVQSALIEYHKRMHLDPASGTYMMPHPWECEMRAVATLPGSVIYEMTAKLYQVSYTMSGTSAVIGDDHNEITLTPKDAPAAMREGIEERDLTEGSGLTSFKITAPLFEGTIDREAGIIHDAVIMNAHSVNGRGAGGRRYSEAALRKIALMAEGAPCYANHVKDPAEAFKPRDIREAIGKYQHVRFEPVKQRVIGNLNLAEHHKGWVLSLADTLGDHVGNSPVTRGVVRMEGDTEVVDDIVNLRSVDLVSDPATTHGLFEHREHWLREHTDRPQGGERMTASDIVKYLRENPVEAKIVRDTVFAEAITIETKAAVDSALVEQKTRLDSEKAVVVSEHEKTKTLLTEATAKLDKAKAEDEVRAKSTRLVEALDKSDLKVKFGTLKHAVTDAFRTSLMESDEAKWPAMIADRVQGLSEAACSVVRPRSAPKDANGTPLTESNGVPEGAHARLAGAFKS